MDRLTEIELVKLAQAGNKEAVEKLFIQFEPLIKKFVYKYAKFQPYTEEVFQEASIIFLEILGKFKLEKEVRLCTFLYICLSKRIGKLCKKLHKKKRIYQQIKETHKVDCTPVDSRLLYIEEVEITTSILNRLSDVQRDILLQHANGVSLSACSEALGITKQRASQIFRSALAAARQVVRKFEDFRQKVA